MEIVIAMGIMTMVGLGYMRINAKKSQDERTTRVNSSIEEFTSELKAFMDRDGYCTETFRLLNLQQNKTIDVPSIRNPLGVQSFVIGQTYKDGHLKLSSLKLDGFQFDNESKTNGLGTLVVGIEKLGNIFGGKHVEKKITLSFNFSNTQNFLGCSLLTVAKTKDYTFNALEASKMLEREDVKEALKNNPEMLEIQKAIQTIKQQNEAFNKEMPEDY